MARTDERFMRMAVNLARRGMDRPSSEPRVGAVVLAGGRIVGRGYASAKRSTAAVIAAIEDAGTLASGSEIYTNVDPCSDAVDVEACLGRLLETRPARIVVGSSSEALLSSDNASDAPDVEHLAIRPLDELRKAGVEVLTGVCEQECYELNESFFKYSRTGLPFVTVKFAQTLDGRIATTTGDSHWISSQPSLRLAHRLRREHDAIMVGIGTVLMDDPRLTVRLVDGRDPLRVIVDSRLRIPITAKVLAEGAAYRTLVVTSDRSDPERVNELEQIGADVLTLSVGENPSGIGLLDMLEALGRRRVGSVLVEGGAAIITSILAARRVDRMVVVIAPKIIGRGIEAVGDLHITQLRDAITFSSVKTRRLGSDIVVDARV